MNLIPLHVDPECPEALRNRAANLIELCEQLQADKAELDADRAAFRAMDPAALDLDVMATKSGFQQRAFRLLSDEVTILEGLATLVDDYAAALGELVDEASARHDRAKADVRKRLEAAGYAPEDAPPETIGRLTQGMILAHPLVVAARNRHAELEDKLHDRANYQHNSAALAAARNRFNAEREKLMATV
jgi:hypothetical protein